MNPYILLWFEAPLQSWGHDSKFGKRDSLDFPTKSGVLGLLCCALGAGGEQKEWLAKWADEDMQVEAYVRKDKNGNPLTRIPMLRDFQMIGSGYNKQNAFENLMIPKTSDGSNSVGEGTKLTYRYYLQDMTFAIALQGEEQELQRISHALQNPVWDLYLGRKNCVPTEFIFQGVFETAQQAFKKASEFAESKKLIKNFRVQQGDLDSKEGEAKELLIINDIPLQFGEIKKYRDRKVSVFKENTI